MARPRKPTKLHLVHGTARKDRQNPAEPQPEPAIPECPPFLQDEARAEWDRITVDLDKLQLIGQVDLALLALYCQTWADYIQACEAIAAQGAVVRTEDGYVRNPWTMLRKQAAEQLLRVAPHFGLSAATRARLTVPQKPAANPLTELMNRGKSKA